MDQFDTMELQEPLRDTSTPAENTPGYGNPNAGYANPNPGYPNPNNGYPNPNPGYANPNNGYYTPGYGNPNQGYGNPNPGYGNPNNGYNAPGYGNPNQGTPNPGYGAPRYPGFTNYGPMPVNCRGLAKVYGPVCALNHIDLQLTPGKIVGLLGPNGSGKTTLIKILTGLLQPTEGSVEICGVPVGAETKAMVSYLPDKMFYADWMRAVDLLDLFTDFYPDFRRDRAESMCASLAIPMKMKIKNMSKGTQEKLQLIVTMARRAKLYLLDEPIAGVDPAAREFILGTIMANCDAESTVVISTHLILDVEPILDEAIFLQRGRIVCYDSVENIRKQEGKSLDELFREIFRMQPMQYGTMGGGMWPC